MVTAFQTPSTGSPTSLSPGFGIVGAQNVILTRGKSATFW